MKLKIWVLLASVVLIVTVGCGKPDLTEVAKFHEDWREVYLVSDKTIYKSELLTVLNKIDIEWDTPEERARWSAYVRAHQLDYWADVVDEEVAAQMRNLLVAQGFDDPFVGCIFFSNPEAWEVSVDERATLERIDFSLPERVCPLISLARKEATMTRTAAEFTWLNDAYLKVRGIR